MLAVPAWHVMSSCLNTSRGLFLFCHESRAHLGCLFFVALEQVKLHAHIICAETLDPRGSEGSGFRGLLPCLQVDLSAAHSSLFFEFKCSRPVSYA